MGEPIGNVLYVSFISILSTSPEQWARASALYNRLADSLAKAQGVQRDTVDLIGSTKITPNPADYTPPPRPGSSLV